MSKIASPMLMYPSQTSIAISGEVGPAVIVQPSSHASIRHAKPIAALAMGPTTRTRNRSWHPQRSFSSCATPPSANSVIERTGSPRRLATIACDSSCATMAAKKRKALQSPCPILCPGPSPDAPPRNAPRARTNQQSDDQPTVVQSDFDAEDSAQFNLCFHIFLLQPARLLSNLSQRL